MIILKEGVYVINLVRHTLIFTETGEDASDLIFDFSPFYKLALDSTGDCVELKCGTKKSYSWTFTRYPSNGLFIKLSDVLAPKMKKEDNKMEEINMVRELTPEERIKELEGQIEKLGEEKADLQEQIEKQEEYRKIRESGDSLAFSVAAIQDSGFSREEAMQIFMLAASTMLLHNASRMSFPFHYPPFDGI